MSSMLSTLLMSANAMSAFDRALQVTQNNVANVSTPGFAKQSQLLIAMPFDPVEGTAGGVRLGQIVSARDDYAEQAVREQTVLLGAANQNVNSLSDLQTNFDITGNSGLPKALNTLIQAFSAWGQTPNDSAARQNVIEAATTVAQAFQQTANGLAEVTQNTNQQLQQTVANVNQLLGQIGQLNSQILRGDRDDAGLDAELHSNLEQLANYVPIQAMQQANGSTTILLAGQTPLLIGDQQYPLSFNLQQDGGASAVYPYGPPTAHVASSEGADITNQIASGQLGALLNIRNQVLPSYIGDSAATGDLNTMAKQFADRVNQVLTSGTLADGSPGIPLFAYASQGGATAAADDTSAAQTIEVNPDIAADQLAAVSPGPPEQSNGVPLALSQLANPLNSADEVGGQSFTQFYGSMAARVGSALSNATNEQQIQQSAVAQAQNLRQRESGVDLNEEAMKVLEFQRAYEANARLVTVLDQLTEDVIQMVPQN